jgi:hypothetical protein
MTDFLRYWPMLEIFWRESITVRQPKLAMETQNNTYL